MNQLFDSKRVVQTIVREFALNKLNLLIIAGSMILISLVITYIAGQFYASPTSLYNFPKEYHAYPIVIFIYCIAVTSFIFAELNVPEKQIDYLMLPSSTFEKYISKFLLTTFGFLLLAVLAHSINTMQVNILNRGISTNDLQVKSTNFYEMLKLYLVWHSVFFFGSVYFRKMELAKTILVLVGIGVFIYFYAQFLKELGLVDLIQLNRFLRIGFIGYNDPLNQVPSVQSLAKLSWVYHDVLTTSKVILTYVIPLIFWALGFIRLREIEVKDGV